ncbi:hypothetical protein PNU84_14585, partial [Turicibacter sanguinis]|uniref:hypothetical protein n=1 Tax=Turicibacter sanguinis TaxID=154288 RepID=UPI00232E0C00
TEFVQSGGSTLVKIKKILFANSTSFYQIINLNSSPMSKFYLFRSILLVLYSQESKSSLQLG